MKGNEMASYKVTINTDNAAFEDCGAACEVGGMLRDLAYPIERHGLINKSLHDSNGNRVGKTARTGPAN